MISGILLFLLGFSLFLCGLGASERYLAIIGASVAL